MTDLRQNYARSVNSPEEFWGDIAKQFRWIDTWTQVKNTDFTGEVSIRWFEGASLNITDNCLDRHLEKDAQKPAIIWEPDDPKAETRTLTFQALYDEVCRFANGLKAMGVNKGDRVTIYMPMVPEAAIAMLATARIGAVHSVVFAGFSAESLRGRIEDCGSQYVITADEGRRAGKVIPLKATVDAATQELDIKQVVVYQNTGGTIAFDGSRDVWWAEVVAGQKARCEPEPVESEDPLFILYTSGSTGKPKGLLHTSGGYMVFTALTHQVYFDIQPDDVYWCTADVGWITGHSYIVYGPLLNGCTTLMFEGVPTYPDASRFWQVVDRHKVTKFYTAPTAIRMLMREGEGPVKATSRASLKLLASVGEPINPEAWNWYHDVVGEGRCRVIDTYWQTETGGHIIAPYPDLPTFKPGFAMTPFYGIQPELYTNEGVKIEGVGEGLLCIADSWPGQARSIWGDHARFRDTYFSTVKGCYFTGDGALRDADGDYRITGRVDDVINVSGHRFGTAEIEAALNEHPDVVESAVVGMPHEIKGQGIYAYVILNEGVTASEALAKSIKQEARTRIGPIATPDVVHITPGLPKTRSGKIMRRILRKIAEKETEHLGDISTLLNPEIVEYLLKGEGQF